MNSTTSGTKTSLCTGTTLSPGYCRVVATPKMGHHSSFSGYEQLVDYVEADQMIISRRGAPKSILEKWFGRLLRRFSLSRWYQNDGMQAEWAAIRTRLKTRKSVVLHYLYGDAALGLLPYFCKYFDIKLIATIHSCPKDIPVTLRKRLALKSVSRYIVLGNNQIGPLLDLGIPSNKISHIPHGVVTAAFTGERQDFNSSRFSILIVGNWKRRYQLYLKVCELYSDTPGVVFNLVTRHSVPNELENIPSLKIWRNISDGELKKMYLSSSCMLLALEDAVANNVVLESMASGLPIICENVGAVDEYLGKEYPLFFDAEDPQGAVEKIESLRNGPKLAASVSDQLRARASTFDWTVIACQVEELYEGLYQEMLR